MFFDISGIRGKDLSSRIKHVYEEFKEQFVKFGSKGYDCLDPQDESFINDYEKFKTKTFELDRKLGAVLGRSFDDCLVTESIFKLLQIFGSLIQRSLIAQELSDRMPILVDLLNTEMDESKVIYTKQMGRIAKNGKASVDKNMPPMCGQLKWANELKAKQKSISHKFVLVVCFKTFSNPQSRKVFK